MRWESGRRSGNVEDRRGIRVTRGLAGGGIGTIVLVLVAMYFGIDPRVVLQGAPSGGTSQVQTDPGPRPAAEDRLADFASAVLADTEDTWGEIFRAGGRAYEEPGLVLFTGAVESACGFAEAAMGPFYCPRDRKVYLDLVFFRDLEERFAAPGDFARAYVIAHEVGHHVQNLLGVEERVRAARARAGEREGNRLSVLLELQADCLAGIWGHHAERSRRVLEAGDVEEALGAASAIGDDRLQRQGSGRVVPDSFTHGTSEQRARWFRRGLDGGDLSGCDTFAARDL